MVVSTANVHVLVCRQLHNAHVIQVALAVASDLQQDALVPDFKINH